jgi:hypothetical protein
VLISSRSALIRVDFIPFLNTTGTVLNGKYFVPLRGTEVVYVSNLDSPSMGVAELSRVELTGVAGCDLGLTSPDETFGLTF